MSARAEDLFEESFFRSAQECTVEAWLAFLGHRWNALILYHLSRAPHRFGELSNTLPGATAKMLTERLVQLERFGLIERPAARRGQAYRLTATGLALMPLLDGIERWARDAFPLNANINY